MDAVFMFQLRELIRLLAIGPLTYAALVVTLRVAGKRTLAKLNAFDLVVTVALGSTFSSALMSREVTLTHAVAAILLLIGLQFAVAWASVHLAWIRKLTRSEPVLLFEKGQFDHARMRRERLTESEIRQAMRSSGCGRQDRVAAVVLETDGSLSVLVEWGDLAVSAADK